MFASLRAAVAAAVLGVLLPIAATAQTQTATLLGTVRTVDGNAVAGANVLVSGPQRAQTTTDATGAFTVTGLAPGIYHIDVTKGGFLTASLDQIALLPGATQPVTATLTRASLNSLQTIATVRSLGAGSSINTGAAATSIVSRAQIQALANPQVNDIVQRIPGASLERGSSSPNTSISLVGSQPYETQVLLDGHPLSGGRYGTFFSQFFNSYQLQGIETENGPGNTTPFAGTAVGGTANFLTPNFTQRTTAEFSSGFDTYGTQFSSALLTGSAGKLQWVLAAGAGGQNGPFAGKQGCLLSTYDKATWNTPASTGIISSCGPIDSAYGTKGEVAKLRVNFSTATSLELGFVGSQASYLPQATTYGVDAGGVPIAACLPISSGGINGQACTSPFAAANVGKPTQGYFFYPGSNVYNTMPIFEGQLSTAIGDNTLLVRPYQGAISRVINGSGEANYPQFWYSASTYARAFCTGAPSYGSVGATVNGLTACMQGPYSTWEHDTFKGTTFSFIHPFGDDSLNFTYDYHSDETFACAGGGACGVQVPDTFEKFNTFSLTGDFALRDDLSLKAGGYLTQWRIQGIKAIPTGTTFVGGPLDRTVVRFDPHVALTYQPHNDVSYRLAFGTSSTFPYAGIASGTPAYIPPSGTGSAVGTLTEKNPNITPEHAVEIDFGADKRFRNGSVLSFDLMSSVVHDVFENTQEVVNQPGPPAVGLINFTINAAKLDSRIAMVTFRNEPKVGLGYFATVTATRSVVDGVPLSAYPSAASGTFGSPANGVQQCSDGGNNVCIPYLKGYGSLSYAFPRGDSVSLGVDFEGKNNTYFQPPFWIYDLEAKHPVSKTFDLEVSVQNLLNTNSFGALVRPNAGSPFVGENSSGQQGNAYIAGNLPYPLIPVQPRTARLQLVYHFNR
ncbi:MAG TPA: TonB-dependent receptor [Candidatus Baltobacteraceae bacterium]